MSTKSSLAYAEIVETKTREIHIYRDVMDDQYYIEGAGGAVWLPKKLAEEFAKVVKKCEEKK